MTDKRPYQDYQENDRLLMLEKENARLQQLVAELLMKNQVLRDTLCHAELSAGPVNMLEFDLSIRRSWD